MKNLRKWPIFVFLLNLLDLGAAGTFGGAVCAKKLSDGILGQEARCVSNASISKRSRNITARHHYFPAQGFHWTTFMCEFPPPPPLKWRGSHFLLTTRLESEPIMRSASFSFSLRNGRQKGQTQSGLLACRFDDAVQWQNN